ncbi:tripartite tricarboxylate transporter permease [Actinomadura madurae]|uniref:tripartite tricarboxylate transporter permease n=1 Tax=Actinomadura madurae TaxID=1993 RepID=UPI00399B50AB
MPGDLLDGIVQALSPPTVFWLFLGAAVGLVIGVLPAVGATVGVVLFLPFTYGMDLPTAIVFLLAIYTTGQYGDSVSSILLRTPGGPGTIASCWDGYPMAKRGEGARALGISTLASMLGGLIGAVILAGLAYPLTQGAMELQPPEYFMLGIMALALVSVAAHGQTLKGIVMAAAGLLVSFVGQDPIAGFTDRFTFGLDRLSGGVPELSVFVGLFAITQTMVMLSGRDGSPTAAASRLSYGQALRGFGDVLSRPATVLRSSVTGTWIGILPGLGVTTATITAYLLEKRAARRPEEFGKGAPAGLAAAETAKGTCAVGDMIPTLTLGIPGSLTGAIILSAFILHGVQPGPQFLSSGSEPFIVLAGITLTQVLIVIAGFPLIKVFTQITRVPNRILAPVLVALCFLGAYVERNQPTDVLVLILAGLFGFALMRAGYPAITFVLGIILGPEIEKNFHRSLQMGGGSPELLWQRPLTITFFAVIVLFFSWPVLRRGLRGLRGHWRLRGLRLGRKAPSGGALVADARDAFAPVPDASAPAPDGTVPGAGEAAAEEYLGVGPPSRRGALILEAALAVTAAVLLAVSLRYPADAATFPVLVSSVLLALSLWQAARSLRSGAWRAAAIDPRDGAGASDRIGRVTGGWMFPAATFLGYYLAIGLAGFVVASVLYMALLPLAYRYRPARIPVSTALVCGALLVVISNALGILLPDGLWG